MKRFAAQALLIASAAISVHAAEKFKDLIDKGVRADMLGKSVLAVKTLAAAVDHAQTAEQRIEARFAYISVLAGSQEAKALTPAVAVQIEQAWQAILAEATGLQSFRAHNDYGVFLLARERPAEAVTVFTAGEKDFSAVSPETQARYLYNFSEAYLDTTNQDAALAAIRRAIELDPAFEAATDKAFRIIDLLPPERAAGEAVSILTLLLRHDETSIAKKWLWEVLDPKYEQWHEQSRALAQVIELCAQWAAAEELDYDEMVDQWLPRMKEAADEASDDVEEKVKQLRLIYKGDDLRLSFEDDAEVSFNQWATAEGQATLSKLATLAGDELAMRDELKRAAERFVAAWRLDPKNVDALIYLVLVLEEWEGAPEDLLDRLMVQAFERGHFNAVDPEARLRLHLVLGSVFEEREQWGPHGHANTAVYQYERALEAYATIHHEEPESVFPGVYASLANAYDQLGMDRPAWQQYLFAAEASLLTGQTEAARVMLEQADQQEYGPNESEVDRYARARAAVTKPQKPEQQTDDAVAEGVLARLWAHPDLEGEELEVSVKDGIVNVRGAFEDQSLIGAALMTARDAPGVKDVRVEVAAAPPQ